MGYARQPLSRLPFSLRSTFSKVLKQRTTFCMRHIRCGRTAPPLKHGQSPKLSAPRITKRAITSRSILGTRSSRGSRLCRQWEAAKPWREAHLNRQQVRALPYPAMKCGQSWSHQPQQRGEAPLRLLHCSRHRAAMGDGSRCVRLPKVAWSNTRGPIKFYRRSMVSPCYLSPASSW